MKKIFLLALILQLSIDTSAHEECLQENIPDLPGFISQYTQRYEAETVSPELCADIARCALANEGLVIEPTIICSGRGGGPFSLDGSRGNCGMTRQEALALESYMGSFFSCLNRSLYSNTGESYPFFRDNVNAALKRFPTYEGFVFRGSTLPESVLNTHQVGQTVRYPAFTSTSTDRAISEDFLDGGDGQMFAIYSKSGRTVMGVSTYESEVLFRSGTNFRIVSRNGNKIVMREVVSEESESEAKEEDARVLTMISGTAKIEKEGFEQDIWHCPVNPESVPQNLMQKRVPNVADFLNR